MSTPAYELRDEGTCWAAVRDDSAVFMTWDRKANPAGILNDFSVLVTHRWGRRPTWVRTDVGWRAS